MQSHDVLIRGAGIVGMSLALALSRQGMSVALLHDTPPPPDRAPPPDIRVYALSSPSVELLRRLKVWDALPPHARTRVQDMQVQGDQGGQLRFTAWQQCVEELAYIVDAPVLVDALQVAVGYAPHITRVASPVPAALTVLCEGKQSPHRAALGVNWRSRDLGQTAIAARLHSDTPHQGVARQWFLSPDILALLPTDALEGPGYGLVWSVPHAQAQRLMALDEPAFEAELQRATQGAAGHLRLASARAPWPLIRATAQPWVGEGWALVGDAAHVVHPLAGQGLNLGLGDVVTLARVLAEKEAWRPWGDARLLRRYERERVGPVQRMGDFTDLLLQVFSQEIPWLAQGRNFGLNLVNQAGPLKQWLAERASKSQ